MSLVSENVHFSYGKNPVLKGLSFEVPKGAVTFLAGNNGSGKTTWLKLALGLLRSAEGSILYDGRTFAATRPGVSVAFDTTPLYPTMSVRDNLSVLFRVEVNEEIRETLNSMGISDYMIGKASGKLSYGQKHRVGIAGTLLREAEYYLLDEPDLGLDPGALEKVSELVRLRRDQGKAVLITGQNYPLLEELSDRITVLSDGKALYCGTVEYFLSERGCVKGELKKAFEHRTGEKV